MSKSQKELRDTAECCLYIAGLTDFGVTLLALAKLPWYSAIGAGFLSGLAAFILFAMFFSIEPL